MVGSDSLGTVLSKALWEDFTGPVLLWPLLDMPVQSDPLTEAPKEAEGMFLVIGAVRASKREHVSNPVI